MGCLILFFAKIVTLTKENKVNTTFYRPPNTQNTLYQTLNFYQIQLFVAFLTQESPFLRVIFLHNRLFGG